MANHLVKLFVDDGQVVYIHHQPSDPSNDEPGKSFRAASKEKVKWKARDDGGFSVEFKTQSPFVSGAGAPGSPIVSSDGSPTTNETLGPIATVTKSFQYTVTMAGITDDPEIIIDNSGGGGASKPKKKKKK